MKPLPPITVFCIGVIIGAFTQWVPWIVAVMILNPWLIFVLGFAVVMMMLTRKKPNVGS